MENQIIIIFVFLCCLCISCSSILLYLSASTNISTPTSPSPNYQILVATSEQTSISPLTSWIGKVVICNNNCTLVITLPTNGSIVADSSFVFLRYGIGEVVINAGTTAITLGVGQFGMALARSGKTWVLFGNPNQLTTINSPNHMVISTSLIVTSNIVDALVVCENTTNDISITLPGDNNINSITLVPVGSSMLFLRSGTGNVQFVSDGISTVQNVLQTPDPTGSYIGMGLFAVATRTASNVWKILGSLTQTPSRDTTYLSLIAASSPHPPLLPTVTPFTTMVQSIPSTILVTSIILLSFMIGTWIQCDNTADIVITLPADSNRALSTPIQVGTIVIFSRVNTGNVSFRDDGTSFVTSTNGFNIGINGSVVAVKGINNAWVLSGG